MRTKLIIACALLLIAITSEAACFVRCSCYDKLGHSGSESQGPFNSTSACMAAVNNMSMRCRSGGPGLMVSCSPCMNCDPPSAPRPGSKQPNATSTKNTQPNQDEIEIRKAQDSAAQKQFENDLGTLKQELKGVDISNQNEIRIKAPPSESALRQLDCARQQSTTGDIEEHGKDLTYSSDCTPVRPSVPTPTPVAADGVARVPPAQLKLQQRVIAKRQELMQRDSEISRLEEAVQAEEFKAPQLKKDASPGESDAMRKAREALAKAKADRARTAAELSKLEKLEATGAGEKH